MKTLPAPPKHPQYPKQQVGPKSGVRWHDRVERGEPPGLYCKLKQNAKCLPQKVVMKQQKKKESRKGGKFRKIEKESKKLNKDLKVRESTAEPVSFTKFHRQPQHSYTATVGCTLMVGRQGADTS